MKLFDLDIHKMRYISGSDQIWNKHSLEMEHNDIKFMYPYLLKGYSGKKSSPSFIVFTSFVAVSIFEIKSFIPEFL